LSVIGVRGHFLGRRPHFFRENVPRTGRRGGGPINNGNSPNGNAGSDPLINTKKKKERMKNEEGNFNGAERVKGNRKNPKTKTTKCRDTKGPPTLAEVNKGNRHPQWCGGWERGEKKKRGVEEEGNRLFS